jgi:FkbM family methyltransferase
MKAKLRAITRSLGRPVVNVLPWSLREALFYALLNRRGRYATLSELAGQFNIIAFKARGEYGVLQSSASDLCLLPVYGNTGQWAPRINNLLKDFFARRGGGTYVDIGANIGLTTIPVARDPRVRCLAIEPEPVNYSHLLANVATNCAHGNVETLQAAVFSTRGTLPLELCSDNIGDNRLRLSDMPGQWHEDERPTVKVAAVPLDEIAPKLDGALAIKIDTQGAEPFIFEGGPKTLACAGLIVMEFWPYGMARMDANPESIITFLENHFDLGGFAEGETGVIPPLQPFAAIAPTLRQSFEAKRADPTWYGDVIVSRED